MNSVSESLSSDGASQSRYFAGWNMVAAAFVVNSISVGFFFYSYGVFLKVLSEEFSASRLEISMGLTLSHVVGSLVAPFLGQAIDKYPLKTIMSLGTFSVSCGFVAISFTQSLLQFYIAIGLFIAVGTSAMGMQSSVKLVANWFIVRRGFALGVATMGTSLAGILMPPITTALLDSLGWRSTFVVFAAFTFFVILPLVRLIVVDRPEDVGQLPDGANYSPIPESPIPESPIPESLIPESFVDEANSDSANSMVTQPESQVSEVRETGAFTMSEAVGSAKFWKIVVVFGILHGTLGAVLIHLIAFATDQGISSYDAAYYLSLSALTGIFSKLVFGWLSDHFDVRVAILSAILFMGLGVVVLASSPSHWQLAVAILIFGVGCGGVSPLRSAVIGKAYGRMRVASAGGLMRLFTLPFVVCGAPLMGWIYDNQGSYQMGFYFLLTSLLVGTIFTLFLKLDDVDKVQMGLS